MKKFLSLVLIVALIGGGIWLFKSGIATDFISSLGRQEVPEDSKWVYKDFSFSSLATENATLRIHQLAASEAAGEFKATVFNPVSQQSETYNDYIVCKDGKLTRTHFERKTSNIEGLDVFTHVEESAINFGTYEGKKISLSDVKYQEAYISENVLYVILVPEYYEEVTVELRFELAQ